MIEIRGVGKIFGDIKAVNNVSFVISEGSIFGLVGTNGAGKSTLIRMMSGVIKPDEGRITIDDMPVYENVAAKRRLFYISDDHYFLNNGTPNDMKRYYEGIYHQFDSQRFDKMIEKFGLRKKQKINTFSKGMKKQLTMICGICANTNYLYCDEAFDGLDPVMRQAVKSILAKEIAERKLTTVIASHNLRELEDICDYVGFLHNGGVLLSKDIEDMKCNIQKIQCVLTEDVDSTQFFDELDIMKLEQRGSFCTITARNSKEEISQFLEKWNLTFAEVLPLSLEEIFISEAEGIGYDIKKIIF